MKIKKIIAVDMQQAMQKISKELGKDAVIINTRKEPIRNLRQLFKGRNIEVTAAVDDAPLPIPEYKNVLDKNTAPLITGGVARTKTMDAPEQVMQMPLRIIPGSIVPTKLPDPILSIHDESDNSWFKIVLKQEVEKGGAEMENGVNENSMVGNEIAVKWKKIFRQMEVNDTITELLFKDFIADMDEETISNEEIFRVHLKTKIISLLKPAYGKENGHRIYSFIGPTGVGKTLTLVKLATRFKVVEKKKIAMIAVFNQRFGAMEKLNFYGNILGVPVDVVMTPAELSRAVDSHRDKDYILIDTEGRPSKNRSQVLELHSFIGAVEEPQFIQLVVSAPTKNRDLIRIANDFRSVGYNGIVITKMDETDSYGSMLNLICNSGVPVSYISNGQNVPDDIERLTPKRFAEIILGSVIMDEDY